MDKQTNSWEEELVQELYKITKEHDNWKYAMHLYHPLKEFISKTISQEKEKWVKEKVKQLTPPENWKQCLKIGTGQDEMCMMCGFNPKGLLDLLQNK